MKVTWALALELAAELSDVMRSEAYERTRAKLPPAQPRAKAFGDLWTSGKLYKDHGEVRGLKDKKTAEVGRDPAQGPRVPVHRQHACGGPNRARRRTRVRASAQAAEKRLGRPWRQASKFQVYQVMHRLFDSAD